MSKLLRLLLLALTVVATSATANTGNNPQIVISTNLGQMTFELYPKAAPKTVANFLRLAQQDWYQGKHFYRVVKGHVIQAGSGDDNEQPLLPAEFNQHPHIRGTLGLARGEDPNSGSTEFYICHQARPHLDGNYTVFGQLIEGDKTLERIANTEVEEIWWGENKDIAFHSPVQAVVIESIRLLKQQP